MYSEPLKSIPPLSRVIGLSPKQIEEQRAQRVWRYATVAWMTWAFFTVFLGVRGYGIAAVVCVVETAFILLVVFLYRREYGIQNYRWIMNLYLGSTAIGLFLVAICDPAVSGTLLFYPVGILIASHLLGTRAALSWLFINLIACCLYAVLVHGVHATLFTSEFDKVVMTFGVGFCTFFCCQQSEALFRKRTGDLVDLSRGLQETTDALREMATTDSLTGLMNRHQFQSSLDERINEAKRDSRCLALLLIDMDGFKEINDTLGHVTGDDALVEIAARLRQKVGPETEVYRLGGDEFCIIQSRVGNPKHVFAFAESLHETLCARYNLENAEFPLGASIGIALFPLHAESPRNLLAYADTAMYHAKENRLGVSVYESHMTDSLVAYCAVQEKLSTALDRDEFFLLYQPQTELDSGKVLGVEALLRWQSDGKTISPIEFIPLLERSRLVIPVSRWIVREVCRQLRQWTDAGYDIRISVNVSVVQFGDSNFCESVVAAIEEFGVDPQRLDFEVTEGVLIENMNQAIERLEELKTLGCTISIDDFGTGYSSLAYLQRLPIDKLKIDRAFVKDIPNADDGTIASSIIVLAKTLGFKTVAEGVETESQLEFLRQNECDQYQGFLQSRPVRPEEVIEFFESGVSLPLRSH